MTDEQNSTAHMVDEADVADEGQGSAENSDNLSAKEALAPGSSSHEGSHEAEEAEEALAAGSSSDEGSGEAEEALAAGSSSDEAVSSEVSPEEEAGESQIQASGQAQEEDVEERAPTVLNGFLATLGKDAEAFVRAISDESVPESVRSALAAGLSYLFKSLDLIDDGIEGLGFLDDAFVLRISAERARAADDVPEEIAQLASDAAFVHEFLGDLSGRFDAFVATLSEAVVRGRSVDAVVHEEDVREEFIGDVNAWASRYAPPPFRLDAHGLVKLRSFLQAKLPK